MHLREGIVQGNARSGIDLATQLFVLHRHGSRYPTSTSNVVYKIQNNSIATTNKATFSGDLSFLNTWTYKLGEQILTPVGKQE